MNRTEKATFPDKHFIPDNMPFPSPDIQYYSDALGAFALASYPLPNNIFYCTYYRLIV